MDLSIIIPCYNEVDNVPKLLAEFLPVVSGLVERGSAGHVPTTQVEVIFVDDGSRDGTFPYLLETFADQKLAGVTFHFTQHRTNRGLGAALRTGMDMAKGNVVVTTDCDGTYHFCEIPHLLARLTPDVDMVTASPYHPHGAVDGVPAYRLLLSRSSSAIYRMLADRRVYTYTALFRAYRREVIQNVPFTSDGFLAGTELLVNAIRMGYRVAEHPTVLHSRAFGVSKAKIIRTVRAHLGFQFNTLLPWHPYGCVVRGADTTLYLYEQGQKHLFPSPEIFLSHGYHWQQVVQISDAELAALPDGLPLTFRDGSLLRSSDETVYIVEHGQRRPFVDASAFETLGYRWENVLTIGEEQLQTLPLGSSITAKSCHPDGTLLRGADETVYRVEDGRLRAIPSVQIFRSWGLQWEQVVNVTAQTLARYPAGEPLAAQQSFFHHWRTLYSHALPRADYQVNSGGLQFSN